ncbi:hypothetical protein B9Q10_01715 [Candidatus Marsarchaeota G2 archaeon ECH_B_SAG-E12]|uniref:Uncharacterized protein n=1 Tax=Candidatus Marsarchaeota G2 archaeon ECH_B_SAG-E12 TaxID=1978164 RepID=A0A2R6BTY7_9ARCH|nr:MAG: hypothetical protein B9Q10_01715 [Candidatus Marsarchaeota G2 archaeon ECH_B_SAG-E12]
MEKALSQTIILAVMITMFALSLPSIIYSFNVFSQYSNYSKAKVTFDAAQEIYADALSLISENGNQSSFVLTKDSGSFEPNWVCGNLWPSAFSPCSLDSNGTSAWRSFTPNTPAWDYVMEFYVPKGMASFLLKFSWWFYGYGLYNLIFGAEVGKGNLVGKGDNAWTNAVFYEFYYSNELFAEPVSDSGQASVALTGDETFALDAQIPPSDCANFCYFSFGMSVKVITSLANFTVLLPTNLQVQLVSSNFKLGPKNGPDAQFDLSRFGNVTATLQIIYDSKVIAQYTSNFSNGETLTYYVTSLYPYSELPKITILFNVPIAITGKANEISVEYLGDNVSLALPFKTIVTTGTSQTWVLMLLGCQKQCEVIISPA